LLTESQRERLDVVLVSPRNPLNIGAAARAMANFGFAHLAVAAPYAPHWREAKSAVGAPDLLASARESATLAEAVAGCTFVAGTGTLTHRKPEQPVVSLPEFVPLLHRELARGSRAALVFGPEKHGLTSDDLSFCHVLVEIPTGPRQPSMNLGQAVAVCLYELVRSSDSKGAPVLRSETEPGEASARPGQALATSADLDRLGDLVLETMAAAHYSPRAMQAANSRDIRLMLRRLALSPHDLRRVLGLFRRILWRLRRTEPGSNR
jgi:tRNA/rRNA methyltransferase